MDNGSADLRLVQVPFGHPDAMLLIDAVQQEYVARYGGVDETPLEHAMFDPPRGSFFVGYVGDAAVATGAWRRRTDVAALGSTRTAEIKRMYVAPAARGRGVARAMLAHLEATAAAAGVEVAILETGIEQPEAIALYESSGYVPVPKFGYYADSDLSRCYARRLSC